MTQAKAKARDRVLAGSLVIENEISKAKSKYEI